MFILYDIIFIIFAFAYFPYLILKGKWHANFFRRFGFFEKDTAERLSRTKNIWVHAVSVGEAIAVSGLIRKLKADSPHFHFVVSVVTPTGFEVAKARLKDIATVVYAPLDFSPVVRAFIRRIRPVFYISMETEIWPNLYFALHQSGVPVALVNGRISESTFNGFRRFPWLTRKILNCVDVFCMQSHIDAMRIFQLGASNQRIKITGNIKFDEVKGDSDFRRADYGFHDDDVIWIAGSTHPGEETVVLSIYKKLLREFGRLRLMIAPRHIERAGEVESEIVSTGLKCVRYSRIDSGERGRDEVVLVDTIGHLRDLYSISSLVFVGKSLKGKGGQNIIEPAAFGKPILTGPNMQNFQSITEQFLESKAIIQVPDEQVLEEKIRFLLTHPDEFEYFGKAAAELVQSNQGAVSNTIEVIREYFPK